MNFEDCDLAISRLANSIVLDNKRFDAIVAIARGGWVPGRLLSKYLDVKQLYSFGVKYSDQQRVTPELYSEPAPRLENLSLLLVEDFLETARSLAFVRDLLAAQGNSVSTAAIGYTERSIVIPEYSRGIVKEVPKLPWD